MPSNASTEWSLEKELCRITPASSLRGALCDLGLTQHDDMFTIRTDNDWVRGGDETYIYRFWISHEDGRISGYVIKACVAFVPGVSLDSVLREWISRRKLLAKNGVPTPKLVACGRGIVVEELIPYKLKNILVNSSSAPIDILRQLATFAGVLSKLGFEPVDAFHDLRSRGYDVVIVDFGQDLGPPGISKMQDETLYYMLKERLRKWGLISSAELLDNLYDCYLVSRVDNDLK